MRKILSVLILVSVCTIARSQNLAFSQVLTFSGELPPTANTPGPVYSVPAGKVWKIESLNTTVTAALGYKINSVMFHLGPVEYNTSPLIFPIWLKEGDTVQPFVDHNSFPMCGYLISIIEFTAN